MQQRNIGDPKYNVVSARLTDEEFDRLNRVCQWRGAPKSEVIRQAVLELMEREGVE
jgi:predicted DNA-binding protein